jgi:L-fucono-1,5-lactonase
MTDRIDAHQHFWQYRPDQYAWIGEGMDVIRRDFLPSDLESELLAAGIGGAVSLQARQTTDETDWLLDQAERHVFLRGVVGWAPLKEPAVAQMLEKLAGRPKLKGLRHILHDEPDDAYMLREDFNAGVSLLQRFHLTYDILIFERHLPHTLRFVDRHPNQVFILDHIAKPRIRDRILSPWRENMAELAHRENVYCKLSGVVTEADWQNWTPEDLRPYVETALEAFGPRRLMFGSDWPVLLLAGSYRQWNAVVSGMISGLSAAERERILGGTATEAYGL